MIDSVIKRFLVTGSIRELAMYKVFLCFFRDTLRLSPNGQEIYILVFLDQPGDSLANRIPEKGCFVLVWLDRCVVPD